jgi:hypothetical protein
MSVEIESQNHFTPIPLLPVPLDISPEALLITAGSVVGKNPSLSRREFLKKSIVGGVAVAALHPGVKRIGEMVDSFMTDYRLQNTGDSASVSEFTERARAFLDDQGLAERLTALRQLGKKIDKDLSLGADYARSGLMYAVAKTETENEIFVVVGDRQRSVYKLGPPPAGYAWDLRKSCPPNSRPIEIDLSIQPRALITPTAVQTTTLPDPEALIHTTFFPIVLRSPEPPPPSEFPFLKKIHVEGPYIVEEGGRQVEFKGVNVYTFHNGKFTHEDAKKYIDIAKAWGSNFIRLQLDIDKVPMSELKKTVDYIQQQHMYCILCPSRINTVTLNSPECQPNEFNALAEFSKTLASTFADKNHVLFSLLNEPAGRNLPDGSWHPLNWNEWFPWANKIATNIRQIKADAILVLAGINYCRDYNYLRDHPWPYENTCFDVHYYRWVVDGVEVTPPTSEWDWMVGKHPIIFGEAGVPGAMGGRNHPLDGPAIQTTLGVIRAHPLMAHYAGFEMAPPTYRTSLIVAGDSPSTRGIHYYNDLKDPTSPPPTAFN